LAVDVNDGVIEVNGGPPAAAIEVMTTGVNGELAPETQETSDGLMVDSDNDVTLIASDVTAPAEKLDGLGAAPPPPLTVPGCH
jgi:hypothetical protein